jgi:hypothetical protein
VEEGTQRSHPWESLFGSDRENGHTPLPAPGGPRGTPVSVTPPLYPFAYVLPVRSSKTGPPTARSSLQPMAIVSRALENYRCTE